MTYSINDSEKRLGPRLVDHFFPDAFALQNQFYDFAGGAFPTESRW